MADNRTPHLNLPLPHQDNLLENDVLRLRDALTGLDEHARETDKALQAADTDKADKKKTEDALALKADKAEVDAALATKAEAMQGHLAQKADKTALSTHAALKSTASAIGHVQLATDAEVTAGTVANKAVSPKQLKAESNALKAAVTLATREDKAASYTAGGSSATATGFKILSGADIGTLFGKVDTITVATSGSGAYVSNVAVAVNGKAATIVQTRAAATYCTYCTHCGHCHYCTYCTYCNCNCKCDCHSN